MEIKEYLKQRDEALISLNKKKIIALSKEFGDNNPLPEDENVFWAEVHYARLGDVTFSEAVKQESRNWLKENDFSY